MNITPLRIALILATVPWLNAAEPGRRLSLVLDPTPGRATQHGVEKLRAALDTAAQGNGWVEIY